MLNVVSNLTRFSKTGKDKVNAQMVSRQRNHWLTESPTIFIYL